MLLTISGLKAHPTYPAPAASYFNQTDKILSDWENPKTHYDSESLGDAISPRGASAPTPMHADAYQRG
jgi:hypothetical protein